MSELTNYRLNFWGGFTTNVCTANNNDRGAFVVNPVDGKLGPDYIGLSDEDVIAKLKANNPHINSATGDQVNSPLGSWNYGGDFSTYFSSDTKITSYGEPGEIIDATDDFDGHVAILASMDPGVTGFPTAGSPVMLDVDSTGTTGTQILVGGLVIGTPGNPLLHITQDAWTYARSLGRRVQGGSAFTNMAATWQIGFAIDDSWVWDESNEVMATLKSKAEAAKGIIIRFSIFEVSPALSGEDLLTGFEKGQTPFNPGLGYVIGSIGIWEEDEFATCPAGRVLNPMVSGTNSIAGSDVYLLANETSQMVSINLVQSIQKKEMRTDLSDTSAISENVDTGQLSLWVNVDEVDQKILDFDYDPVNYYKYGGVIDMNLSTDQMEMLNQGRLSIFADSVKIFKELDYRIEEDQLGLYLDPGQNRDVHFRIRACGQPLDKTISLTIVQESSGHLETDSDLYTDETVSVTNASDGFLQVDPSISEDFTLNIEWLNPGAKQLNMFVEESNENPPNSDSDENQDAISNGPIDSPIHYIVVKTYPDDDFSELINSETQEITWDMVYEEVLRYYYVIFPAMSQRIALNDQNNIIGYGEQIKKRIADDYANKTLFMPITRSMSPGKRALLTAFIDQELAKQ